MKTHFKSSKLGYVLFLCSLDHVLNTTSSNGLSFAVLRTKIKSKLLIDKFSIYFCCNVKTYIMIKLFCDLHFRSLLTPNLTTRNLWMNFSSRPLEKSRCTISSILSKSVLTFLLFSSNYYVLETKSTQTNLTKSSPTSLLS